MENYGKLLWKIIKGFIQCYHYIESLKLNNMNAIYYNRDFIIHDKKYLSCICVLQYSIKCEFKSKFTMFNVEIYFSLFLARTLHCLY